MLEKDPRLRISAVDALKHPFFSDGHAKNNPSQMTSSNSESMKDEIREDSDTSTKNSSQFNSPLNSPNLMPRQL